MGWSGRHGPPVFRASSYTYVKKWKAVFPTLFWISFDRGQVGEGGTGNLVEVEVGEGGPGMDENNIVDNSLAYE